MHGTHSTSHSTSAGGRESTSTSTTGAHGRSAGARASASTSARGAKARSEGLPLRAGVDGVNGNHDGLAKLRRKAVWSNIGTQNVRQRRENRNVIVQAPLCSPFLCRRLRRCARAQLAAAGGRRERSHCRRTLQLDGGGKGNLGPAQPAGERCRAAEPKRVSAQRSKHCVAHASTLEVDLVRAVRGSTFSNNNSFDVLEFIL